MDRLIRVVRSAPQLAQELALLALIMAIIFGTAAAAVTLLDWAEGRAQELPHALAGLIASLSGIR